MVNLCRAFLISPSMEPSAALLLLGWTTVCAADSTALMASAVRTTRVRAAPTGGRSATDVRSG